MILIEKESEDLLVFEFQGDFENIELYNGVFNKVLMQMKFTGFFLQGKIIQKDFTVFEIIEEKVKMIGQVKEVILFDKPPRYNTISKIA